MRFVGYGRHPEMLENRKDIKIVRIFMNTSAPFYLIEGGTPLYGKVRLSGAKNAVTKLIISTLLTDDLCVLRNVPLLGDMYLTMALCENVGSQAELVDHTLSIHTPGIHCPIISTEVGGLNRMAIISVGPLLHRCGEADIPMPGGDHIGARPIDFHINGLQLMGAKVEEHEGRYHISSPAGLHGATIHLPFPSVMATENFLITASLAKGVTIIENAALEPEIIDLIKFLQKMGAIIEIKVDRRIVIEGVDQLHGAVHTLLSDRNEAVSLAIAKMGAHLEQYTKCLGEVSCRFREKQYNHSCLVRGPTPLSATVLDIPDIRAGCSYILAALSANGTSQVYGIEHIERGYEGLHCKLQHLGARIERIGGDEADLHSSLSNLHAPHVADRV